MRFRAHLLAAAAAGLALYPRSPGKAALVTVAGCILDADHYVLYALRSGDWNPLGALRYNRLRARRIRPGDTRPRYGPLRSMLHRKRLTIPLLWLASGLRPSLQPFAVGVTLHLLLDTPFTLMLDWRVWRRAHGRCEQCGTSEIARGVYHRRSTQRGGSRWGLGNRVLWCEQCAKIMLNEELWDGAANT
ncbi:MAG TPA: hypothetical protein VFT66_12450 [Roseiflexaceae bacterium]|jgi:hypothetical protein|nr:hypothetical protein [Roseiflexaceae bacterium]